MKNEKVKEREKQMGVKEAKEPFMKEEIIYVANFFFSFLFCLFDLSGYFITTRERESAAFLV